MRDLKEVRGMRSFSGQSQRLLMFLIFFTAFTLRLFLSAFAQTPAPDAVLRTVIENPKFKAAMAALDKDHDRFVSEIIQLTEIPAPPFKEAARAKAYLAMLKAHRATHSV